MALAFLCRQLERSALAGAISVTAFVVDHRARTESSQEARTVAGWLTAMGRCCILNRGFSFEKSTLFTTRTWAYVLTYL